jgi:hypothetical protein
MPAGGFSTLPGETARAGAAIPVAPTTPRASASTSGLFLMVVSFGCLRMSAATTGFSTTGIVWVLRQTAAIT